MITARRFRAGAVREAGRGTAFVHLRKILVSIDEAMSEMGRVAETPLKKVAVAAVVGNPFAGKGYVEDLAPLIEASAEIGRHISATAVAALAPYDPESYGKAALVGTAGEQEHGVAMLTTVYGNAMRDAAGGGAAWISSFTKRAVPGEAIDIPLAHKDALYVRSHYDGMTLLVPDAPLEDEIVVICCIANRGRLNHRVGGLARADVRGADGLT